jgi:hypothetical protein
MRKQAFWFSGLRSRGDYVDPLPLLRLARAGPTEAAEGALAHIGQRLGIDDVIAVTSAQHFDRLRSIRESDGAALDRLLKSLQHRHDFLAGDAPALGIYQVNVQLHVDLLGTRATEQVDLKCVTGDKNGLDGAGRIAGVGRPRGSKTARSATKFKEDHLSYSIGFVPGSFA